MNGMTPKYGLHLENLTRMMGAPDEEILGIIGECFQFSAKVTEQQHYMDLMMTASHAVQIAELRQIEWESWVRAQAQEFGYSNAKLESWMQLVKRR